MVTINGRILSKRETDTITTALDCYRDDVNAVAASALKDGDQIAYTTARDVVTTCEQLMREMRAA